MQIKSVTRAELDTLHGENGYITVSQSQLSIWFTCHYKFYLSYVRGFSAGSTPYMDKGKMTHEMQQRLYDLFIEEGSGSRPISDEELLAIKDPVEKKYKEYDQLLLFYRAFSTFVQYTRWAAQNDDFIPLQTEFEVFAPTGIIKNGKPVYLHGIIDLLVERNGEFGVVDHKSFNSERGRWGPELVNFDMQLHFYMLMLHLIGFTPDFGCINGLNTYEYKNMPAWDVLFNREDTYKTVEQLENYQKNVFELIDEIYDAKGYPKRLTKDCKRCGYREVCDMELRGMDVEVYLQMRHSKDIPDLADTEIALEELIEGD